MARVRSTGNRTTEWRLRGALIKYGVSGWRLNSRELPGRPDFVFREAKVAVFVDGCFWHGCPSCGRLPKTRQAFWRTKIAANVLRDKRDNRKLRQLGWTVVRIWEHELKSRDTKRCISRIRRLLESRKQ